MADQIFNVRDYGAKGDGSTLDTAAIQRALDAAHAAGGGTVYIPAGTYIVHSISGKASDGALQIRSNVTLVGDGMGASNIKVMDGEDTKITGILRTPSGEATKNVVVRDLTLDGNHQNNSGEIDGFFCGVTPGSTQYDENILIERVEIMNVSRYGFDPHEQTRFLTIRDSVAHDNLGDGFTIDFCFDTVLANNVAYNNGRYGFNIVTSSHDVLLTNNVAYHNAASGIAVQKGSDDRPFIYDIRIEGGASYGNGRNGINIKFSEKVTVYGVDIYGNAYGGVLIEGAQDNLIQNNRIHDNGGYGVRIKAHDDPGTGKHWASYGNTVSHNDIQGQATAVIQASDDSWGNAAYANVGGGAITGVGVSPLAEASGSTNLSYLGYQGVAAVPALPQLSPAGPQAGGIATEGPDTLVGGESADVLAGGAGADCILGGGGDDEIRGGDGEDFLRGGAGQDLLYGGAAFDNMHGNTGSDTLWGGDGGDWVVGGQDSDLLMGEAGDDYIVGNLGSDTADGGDGADTLLGGQADDLLTGGLGNDYLSGDRGADTLTGGGGADQFWSFSGAGVDRITDFNRAEGDSVRLAPGTGYSVRQEAGDVVVDLGNDDRVILADTQLSTLGEGWLVA